MQLFVYVVFILIWLWVVFWVKGDAKARGADATLWFWLVLLLGWVPLLIYFLAVRPKGEVKPCPSCMQKRLVGLSPCPHCDNSSGPSAATNTENMCVHCGAKGQGKTGRCSACGSPLTGDYDRTV